MLRRIFGSVFQDRSWRVWKNKELKELFEKIDVVTHIKKGRLRWIGHVKKMQYELTPRTLLGRSWENRG